MAIAARASFVLLCLVVACGGSPPPGGDPGSVGSSTDGGAPGQDGGSPPDAGPNFSRLTVVAAGAGSGRITSSPTGIDCGETCAAPFAAGTRVTLTAAPLPGSTFAGWGGGCSGTGACVIALDVDTTVSATFQAQPPSHRFNVTVSLGGRGSGRVTSRPAGIDCPSVCTADFPENGSVTLVAAPTGGSSFSGWSGACVGAGDCIVTAAASVTASFALPQISIAVTPATASLATGARQQFTATVTGSADTGVVWSVEEGTAGGTVDGTGIYVAPSKAGVYHVVATSHADSTKSAAATVTITSTFHDLPPRLSMAAFDSSLSVGELSFAATGGGSARMGKISLQGSEGTVELDGRALPSIVFERQPLGGQWQTNAYEVVSIAPDRLYLSWIYCRTTNQELYQVWVESTMADSLVAEGAHGTCDDKMAQSNPRLRAPDVSMDWPRPARGYSVSGADLPVMIPKDLPGKARRRYP